MMIDFGPIFAQVLPYLWIPMLFISLAILVKRMKSSSKVAQDTQASDTSAKESDHAADR